MINLLLKKHILFLIAAYFFQSNIIGILVANVLSCVACDCYFDKDLSMENPIV